IMMVVSMLPASTLSVFAADTTYPYAVADTEAGTVTIDGTLGDKTTATEEDINALLEAIKDYVDSGITTIIVTGGNPAVIEVSGIVMPAVSEAIYRLSGNGNYDENNPYKGKIDLVLPDVTEIVAMEFYAAFALNSITLPKVTTVGDGAFTGCYYLKKMTFGSVVTSINQSNSYVFYEVGKEVDGGSCDLVLNCGQLEAEDTYKPDLENNVWFKPSWGGNVTWKSITLTHTGECDECKANQ
ncbi:MAG: leucine-rich repeat protein, partial [Bacteroides sp.]|nr:leucine-rich repeat protein [Bacteroides sp.]